MLITNMPNLKTRTNVACNAETGCIDSNGLESEAVREVTNEISSEKRSRFVRKCNGDVIPM